MRVKFLWAVTIVALVLWLLLHEFALAWSCADGTCSGPGWAGTGAGHFTGAGDDYPVYAPQQPPIIIVVPPPKRVYPRGYDQDTGQCYDLDAC